MSLGLPPFVSMCVRGVVVVHGVSGLLGLRLFLGVLVDPVSGVFISLGTFNASLQFIMIDFQFSEFFLMTSFNFNDAGLELSEWIIVRHGGHRSKVRIFWGVSLLTWIVC